MSSGKWAIRAGLCSALFTLDNAFHWNHLICVFAFAFASAIIMNHGFIQFRYICCVLCKLILFFCFFSVFISLSVAFCAWMDLARSSANSVNTANKRPKRKTRSQWNNQIHGVRYWWNCILWISLLGLSTHSPTPPILFLTLSFVFVYSYE